MTSAPVTKFTLILCLIVSQATLLYSFGYATCVQLLWTTTEMERELKMTHQQLENFVEDAKYTLFLACFFSGFLADFLGRRMTLIISGVLSCFGFLIMSLAISYGVLMTGRVISLAGLGLGLPVAPLYIGEVAPPSRRGLLNTIPEVFSSLGIWLAVVTRVVVQDLLASSQWRAMLGVGIVPSLILWLGMVFMPESPCWLVRRARVADAKDALRMILRTSDEVDIRLSALRIAARIPSTMGDVNFDAIPQDIHVLAIWHEFRCPVVRPILKKIIISILTLHFFQQIMGTDLLTFDSLSKLRYHDPFMAIEFLMEQLPSLFGRLLPILVPMFLSDIIGRKKLVLYSLMLGIVSMLVMNFSLIALKYQLFDSRIANGMNKWSISTVLGSFSLGLGPMTWVHTSEILPFKIRAQLIGIIVMMNRLLGFGLKYLKPILEREVGMFWAFLYLVLNILIMVGPWLCNKYVIETKNRSLEEMDEHVSPTLELSVS